MKKNIQYQFGASLFALAFSLVGADEAWAQTCVPPPSCNTLGFTKTAADCAGKTILKCPFDTTKVYCPGAEEQGDTPYEVGDEYYVNGYSLGRVIEASSTDVKVASNLTASSEEITDYCARLTPGVWAAPDKNTGKKIFSVYKGSYDSLWSYLRINDTSSTSNYCMSPSGSTWSKSSCNSSSYTRYNSCVITVQQK